MSITMPQAIMLNHAAWVSRKNSDRKYEAKRNAEKKNQGVANSPIAQAEEEYVNNLSPEDMTRYMLTGWE